MVQHIAGRSSAKEKNANLIEAIKAAGFPHDRYQTTTIVNTDDAIPGTGMFVRNSIESNKKALPMVAIYRRQQRPGAESLAAGREELSDRGAG